jgi:hypothetical protein
MKVIVTVVTTYIVEVIPEPSAQVSKALSLVPVQAHFPRVSYTDPHLFYNRLTWYFGH